jgi:hypothetical protein
MKEFNEDLDCPNGISVGNWQWGDVVIKPQPGARTSIDVTGLNIDGEGDVFYQVSVKSAYPWVTARMATVTDINDTANLNEDPTQFRIWFWRRTDYPTRIHWMVWRNPSVE